MRRLVRTNLSVTRERNYCETVIALRPDLFREYWLVSVGLIADRTRGIRVRNSDYMN